MYHKKRKLKKPFKIILVLSLILSLGLGVLYTLNQYPESLMSISAEDKNFGKDKNQKEKSKDFIKVYHFPDTNIKVIQTWIDEVMLEHDDYIANNLKEDHKLEVKQDYSSESFNDLASVKLSLWVDGVMVRETARSFDTKEKAMIPLSALFTEAGQNIVTTKMRNTFPKNDAPRDEFLEEFKSQSFERFYIGEETLDVYFSDAFGNKEVFQLPLAETTNYLVHDLGKHTKTDGFVPSTYMDRGVSGSDKLLAFTFDDGPHWEVTEKLMDTLEAHNGQGTFFVVGERVEDHEDNQRILKAILDRKHQLANHSYDHKNFNTLSLDALHAQIDKTNAILEKATGYPGPYMVRPPFGNANAFVRENTDSIYVNWSVDTLDWQTHDPKMICEEIMKMSDDGDIILLHDLYETSYEGFKCAIEKLDAQGYKFVTVEELLKAREVDYQAGNIYFDAYQ